MVVHMKLLTLNLADVKPSRHWKLSLHNIPYLKMQDNALAVRSSQVNPINLPCDRENLFLLFKERNV